MTKLKSQDLDGVTNRLFGRFLSASSDSELWRLYSIWGQDVLLLITAVRHQTRGMHMCIRGVAATPICCAAHFFSNCIARCIVWQTRHWLPKDETVRGNRREPWFLPRRRAEVRADTHVCGESAFVPAASVFADKQCHRIIGGVWLGSPCSQLFLGWS